MRYYIGSVSADSNFLSHHGIKGQKWGVRRYQNPDGSLTAAGRYHYRNASKLRTGMRMLENPDLYNSKYLEPDQGGMMINELGINAQLPDYTGHAGKASLFVTCNDSDGKPFSKEEAKQYLLNVNKFIKDFKKIDSQIRNYIADKYYDQATSDAGVTKEQFKNSLTLMDGNYTWKSGGSLADKDLYARYDVAHLAYTPWLPEETGWYDWWFNSDYDISNGRFVEAWLH